MSAVQISGKRIAGVDALRGLAAIAVLLYHVTLRPTPLVPLGFAGVEVFFCISGFILAYAYEDKLDAGMSAGSYAVQRWLRLYPLYALGLVFGLVVYLAGAAVNGSANPPAAAAVAFVKGVFLIPIFTPFTIGDGPYLFQTALFPYDNPAWSLLIEAVCSVVFFFWRPRGLSLTATLAGLAALLFGCILATDHLGGGDQATFLNGYPRGFFCFYAGLAVYRVWRAGWLETLPRSTLAALALLAFGAMCKLSSLVYFAIVFVGAPWLVVLATAKPGSRRLERLYLWLGDISYPLYMIHVPLSVLVRLVAVSCGLWSVAEPSPRWASLALLPLSLAVSWLVAKAYDEPARRWLTRQIFLRPLVIKSRPAV